MTGSSSPLGEMFAWLASDDARAAAATELHRRALPVALVDDVLNTVAIAVAAADLDDVENPVAYARRVVTIKTIDLLRGRIRVRSREEPLDDGAEIAQPDAVSATVVAAELEDAVRLALHRLLVARRPWVAAAGLTALTLAAHPDVALPRFVPTPDGAAAGQADRWAALWLAGERHCFPDGDVEEDAAMRQRRSRALRAIEAVLHDAASAAGLRGVDV